MARPVVSVTKYEGAYGSVRRALESCGGLAGLRPDDRILLKPNLVEWDLELPNPPWGVVTTSAVMGALVRVLTEEGHRHLTIGEGTPLPHAEGKGRKVFGILGYEGLRDRYGVELVDFDEEPFGEVDLGDFRLSLARRALEADKIVSVPVLKTHGICKVSLGIKNLKGFLNRRSKRFCHDRNMNLDHTFPRLLDELPVALSLIDGVFALERGPTHNGRAYRRDLLVASTDLYAADVVGARLIGYDAAEIPHLRYYGERHGGCLDLEGVEVHGEGVAEHQAPLAFDTPWREDDSGPAVFDKKGIQGLAFRKPDHTLCTGCVSVIAPALIMLMSSYDNETSGSIEVITGKRTLAQEGFEKTVLLGRCPTRLNKGNPNIGKSLCVDTCPASIEDFVQLMQEEGVGCDYGDYERFRHHHFSRYKQADGFDPGFYSLGPDAST